MKKRLLSLFVLAALWISPCFSSIRERAPALSLETIYSYYSSLPAVHSDIGEHLYLLKNLAEDCPHVTEIGVRYVVSTWALLQGLTQNPSSLRHYVGIDIATPSEDYALAKQLALDNGIAFSFIKGDDLYLDIEPTDLLFIDSLHTYCHLTSELEKFSPRVKKYIALHDTSEPWGDRDDTDYHGNYTEYPSHYDRSKRGLWPAVEDFLNTHPEWVLHERHFNCHGFTILRRVGE